MAPQLYIDETPDEVKNAKGLHLLTMNTPNGQPIQILLEELKEAYGTEWTTTVIDIMTNEQKKEWFLRLNPNGMPAGWIESSKATADVLQAAFLFSLTILRARRSRSWRHLLSCFTSSSTYPVKSDVAIR
jgi:hypothetical protein